MLPPPEGLPPAERRRTGAVVKLALAVGLEATRQAGAIPRELPAVFTSSGGDGENCHEICQVLASRRAAAVADALSQLGPQRGGRLLEHRDGCDAGLECAVCLRCELRRRTPRGADPGRDRAHGGAADRL